MKTEQKPYGFICIKHHQKWPKSGINTFEPYTTGEFMQYPLYWKPIYADPYNSNKTLGNTEASGTKQNVKDVVFWGDGDTFKLICKASSKAEGWMKSTKAMEIPHVGCVVQVTTQQFNMVAEAVTFVPDCEIYEVKDDKGLVIERKLVTSRLITYHTK